MMRYILLGFISINLMLCGISNTGLNLNQAQAFITLNQEIKSVSIDELEYFLSESPDQLDVSPYNLPTDGWEKSSGANLSLGNIENTAWIRLRLLSTSADESNWVIKTHWANLRNVWVYSHDLVTHKWNMLASHTDWTVDINTPDVLPYSSAISVPALTAIEIYLRVQSTGKFIAPITIESLSQFKKSQAKQHILSVHFWAFYLPC